MSTEDGIDNPAFASDDCAAESRLNDEQQVTLDHKSEGGPVENGHQRAQFVSQQYVEPGKTSPDPHHQRTETKIELTNDTNDKTVVEPKMNGVHGNGNNNDASFLNNSATSVQINGEWSCSSRISFIPFNVKFEISCLIAVKKTIIIVYSINSI